MALHVQADLTFELDQPGRASVSGTIRGDGNRLVIETSDAGAFGGAADAGTARKVAEVLAGQGIVVQVRQDGRAVVLVGAVVAPWWLRRLTGSRRIRLASLRGALTAARALAGARGAPPALPTADLLPPSMLWPPAPTVVRLRSQITTTHDPSHGGQPRLVVVATTSWLGEAPAMSYELTNDMTIGSDPACDVVLLGLEPVHATLRHDELDEWIVEATGGTTRVHGRPVVGRQQLRTGAMLQVGEYQLVFVRDEYADHGRPFGGRTGGEMGHNIAQPGRTPRQSAS